MQQHQSKPTVRTITLEEVGDRNAHEFLLEVVRNNEILIVLMPDGKSVIIKEVVVEQEKS